jgi:RNA polymerase sigma-70 factor (ECF subfamily)
MGTDHLLEPPADQSSALFTRSLTLAREGDSSSLDSIFDGLYAYMRKVARDELPRVLRSKVSPSDVVQRMMLKAWKDIRSFRGLTELEFLQWLRTILHNTIRDFLRFYQARKRDCRREVSLHNRQGEETAGMPSVESPCTTADEADLHRFAAEALLSLPEPYRQVIQLMHDGKVSLQQKADRLGVTPDEVPDLQRQALDALKQHAMSRQIIARDFRR